MNKLERYVHNVETFLSKYDCDVGNIQNEINNIASNFGISNNIKEIYYGKGKF